MLSVLSVIIYALVVLISILLIALILLQPSKSGGLGSAFGGVGESVFGAHAMSHLSKLTVIFITVFFVLTLLLAVISGHINDNSGVSVMDGAAEAAAETRTEEPAAPSAAAAESGIAGAVPEKEKVPAAEAAGKAAAEKEALPKSAGAE